MKAKAQVLDFQAYKDQKMLEIRYQELRDLAAQAQSSLQQLKSFIDLNGLTEVKSNHRIERELAKLCQLELASLKKSVTHLTSSVQIVDSEADVIDIRTRLKKVA